MHLCLWPPLPNSAALDAGRGACPPSHCSHQAQPMQTASPQLQARSQCPVRRVGRCFSEAELRPLGFSQWGPQAKKKRGKPPLRAALWPRAPGTVSASSRVALQEGGVQGPGWMGAASSGPLGGPVLPRWAHFSFGRLVLPANLYKDACVFQLLGGKRA